MEAIRLDDVFRRIDTQLAPGDLFVRNGSGIRAVARGRVADLAEITPKRHAGALQVLVKHRDDADGEIARDAARRPGKSRWSFSRPSSCTTRQFHHVLDAGAHRVNLFHVARNDVPRVHVSQRGVFPAWHEHRQLFLHGREQHEFFGSIWYSFFSTPEARILYMNSWGK